MNAQLRMQLVMTKKDAIEIACRELEDAFAAWLTTAQDPNPNRRTKADKQLAFERAQECQQAIKVLRQSANE